jgi:four helix bundle protein
MEDRFDGMEGHKKLRIWQLAHELVIDIHKMTIHNLPKHEMFEEGTQIRRSIKSVKSTIVEGYGRRSYKQEFIKFLTYAIASNNETIDHLETLFDTESLTDRELFESIHNRLQALGKQINLFIRSVETRHISKK